MTQSAASSRPEPADADREALTHIRAEQAASQGREAEPAPAGSEGGEEEVLQAGLYKAAFLYKGQSRPRLRLHFANGVRVRVLSYAYLFEVVSTSHQWLTLVFSSTVVTLKGRHLNQLIDPLQDERVRALVCFRPGIHPEPDDQQPCILEIQEHDFKNLPDMASA